MSPVGHSLIGLVIGAVARRGAPRRTRAWAVPAFIVLANLPDAPLPGWGHDGYHISHSLPVTLALIAVSLTVLHRWLPERLLVAGAAAWLSHLLLDSFYNHGLGVPVGWPIADYRLNLPIPWLQTLDLANLLSRRNATVVAFELLTFGPFVAAVASMKRKPGSPGSRTGVAAGDRR